MRNGKYRYNLVQSLKKTLKKTEYCKAVGSYGESLLAGGATVRRQ